MKIKIVKMIEVQDWNAFVKSTYGRPYNFQQQAGGQSRGFFSLKVPVDKPYDFDNESVPEEVNGELMGVSFSAWLARDPKQKLSNPDDQEDYCLLLWWDRNFYPNIEMVANDLYEKGLLEEGEYKININW